MDGFWPIQSKQNLAQQHSSTDDDVIHLSPQRHKQHVKICLDDLAYFEAIGLYTQAGPVHKGKKKKMVKMKKGGCFNLASQNTMFPLLPSS